MNAKYPKAALFAVLLTMTAFAVSVNTIPPLKTTIAAALGFDSKDFGLVFMINFLSFAVAAWVGGKVAEKYKLSNRLLVIVGLFTAAALLGVGAMLPRLKWFYFWIIPIGFAGGLIEAFGSVMISSFGKSGSSKLLNLSQAFYCLGAVVAPFVVAELLVRGISWKFNFIIFGGLIALIGIIFIVCTKQNDENENKDISEGKQESLHVEDAPVLLKDTMFLMMMVILFLYVVIESAIAIWVSDYFEEFRNMPVDGAARRLGVFWLGLATGRILMMVLPKRFTLWPAIIGSTSAMVLGTTLLSFQWPIMTATVILFICGFGFGPFWPVLVSLSHNLRHSAKFTAAVIGAGALGAAFGPWISAVFVKNTGWKWFFPALALSSLVLLSIVLSAKYLSTLKSAKKDNL